MIIFTILLVFLTGIALCWLFNQHKYLNIFEQIVFGFGITLSLFVFELFLQGIIFDKLSLFGPVLTFLILTGILIYKNLKIKNYGKEILLSIEENFLQIKTQFLNLKFWQKLTVILIIFYSIFKIFMVFSINTSMPTFDEDAVAGWDIKTKVFVENRSLVLDKNNPEFMGNDYGRFPWAGITDSYFLLLNNNIVGFTNIISPILYLLGFLLIFGILLRKTSLFNSSIFCYIYLSLPFLFIHAIGSYWNYAFGLFLFIFTFYLVDQYIQPKEKNTYILYLLGIFGFLASGIRNEGFMILTLIFGILYFYNLYYNKNLSKIKSYINLSIIVYFGILINKIINYFLLLQYPNGGNLNMGGSEVSFDLIPKLFQSLGNIEIVKAPFIQAFFHSDYNLLYVLFSLTLIYFIKNIKKEVNNIPYLILFFILFFIFLTFLFANLESLGLLTHFAYIRYTLSLFLIIIIISGIGIFNFFKNN